MGKVKMVCHACGAANRLPEEKLADGPRCGVCGAALVGPKVHDLDLATLEKSARTDEVPLVQPSVLQSATTIWRAPSRTP